MSLQQEISYKDPSGFVVKLPDGFYRMVSYSYKKEYDHLFSSGLYDALINKHLMVSHVETPVNTKSDTCYKKLFPQQIDLITYPFEWTYSQWQQMIINYLTINELAMRHGMIIKDASPYNFVFYESECLLIDTLSFDFYTDGTPWRAYKQFCEEMLSTFLLMYYKDPLWAKLSSASITGLPLPFVSDQLPRYTKFNAFCLMHIHLHAKFQGSNKSANGAQSGFNSVKLLTLFSIIKSNVLKRRKPQPKNEVWHNYYDNDIESEDYIADKIDTVTKWLEEVKPGITLDMGANTGKFSFIASGLSKRVYALEDDVYSVEKIQQSIIENQCYNITTLVADITNPSPGLGWDNKEKQPLLQRVKGDTLLALALIHHLCFSKNVPLPFIAKTFADLTSRFAIVEFVPKSDPRSQQLLQNKGDIFAGYNEEKFVEAFTPHFKLVTTHHIKNSNRKLFLWKKL